MGTTARRVEVDIAFNGNSVKGIIDPYVTDVSYDDVAKDKSDSIDITLHNSDMKWLSEDWYPRKGDAMQCRFIFMDWNRAGDNFVVDCGGFVLDDVSFSGNPKRVKLSGVAVPANASFGALERNKTWKKVTIRKIANTISRRYRLTLSYNAPSITIAVLEQSNQTDSEFLYGLCKKYNLGMKVYNNKLIIYDPGTLEQNPVVCELTPESFINGAWTYNDTLDGVYNGARISYKTKKDSSETKSAYFGSVKESADDARTLKISERANSRADAKYKATAAINLSNEQATTLSGPVWPDQRIVSGVCVEVKGFGVPDGKYFIDSVRTDYSSGGVGMSVNMHKCQKRIRRV